MRKTILLISLSLFLNHLSAQSIKFDIEAGANTSIYAQKESALSKNIPNYFLTDYDGDIEGFHAGILAKLNWNKLTVQTGAIYTTKGGDDHSIQQTPGLFFFEEDVKRRLHYTEIPLNVTYNIPFDDYTFFIGGGPYLDLIIKGTYSSTYTYTDYPGTTTGSQNEGFTNSQPNFGIHFLEGVAFKSGFSFNVGYELGLTNVASNGNYIAKNNTIMLSVAYPIFNLKIHHKKDGLKAN